MISEITKTNAPVTSNIQLLKNEETGWWFQPTPQKNHGASNSWDDDIPFPTEWKVIKAMFQTTTQPFIFHYQRVNHH